MGRLDQVTTGRIERPLYMIVYGVDGVGKSTFGATFPRAIFAGPENGTDHLDNVTRLPPQKSWADVEGDVDELLNTQHNYGTLVIDTIDWAAGLAEAHVADAAGKDVIEDIAYGRGQPLALNLQNRLRRKLEYLREKRKMHILLLAHTEKENFTDPTKDQDAYQRYTIKMNKKAAAMWREAVDAVLFANHFTVKEEDKADKKMKYRDSARRVLHTERSPGFDAKNRYGLPTVIDFPKGYSYADFMRLVRPLPKADAQALTDRAFVLVEQVANPEVHANARQHIAAAGVDIDKLTAIVLRLEEILATQGAHA